MKYYVQQYSMVNIYSLSVEIETQTFCILSPLRHIKACQYFEEIVISSGLSTSEIRRC